MPKKIDYYVGVCAACGVETPTTQEVLRVPRVLGGDLNDYRKNHQSLCLKCDARKRDLERDLLAFETDGSSREEWLRLAFQSDILLMKAFTGELTLALHHFDEIIAKVEDGQKLSVTR